MLLLPFFAILYGLYLSSVSVVDGASCTVQDIWNMTGMLSDRADREAEYMKCWRIKVPTDNYVKVNFMEMNFKIWPCDKAYLDVRYEKVQDRFCIGSGIPPNVTTTDDVFMIYYHESKQQSSSFSLQYHTESLNCTLDNHFRCSSHVCIQDDQVCDGAEDCEDGSDEVGCPIGIDSVKHLNISRYNAIKWLKEQRLPLYGWSKNTRRAITALYLSGGATFQEDKAEEELMVKELELKTAGALLRNSSDPLTVNDLGMLINALLVTCYNPRKFYGYDLVQILSERVAAMKTPSPGAYLALCNANSAFSESEEQQLLNTLNRQSEYLFYSDIQAMSLMAINCLKSKKHIFFNKTESMEVYNKTIKKFFESQQPDGSFGNVYTSSLVVQALLSSGEEYNNAWDVVAAVKYLIQQLESPSTDILSTSLVLPILNKKSLVDIASVNCTKIREGGDVDISDVKDKQGRKIQVKYSLYIGDKKDIIHSIYLKVPVNSSAYDIMRVAETADSKYKFQHTNASGHMYIYEIARITNDAESGKFWLLYTGTSGESADLTYDTKSPDKLILTEGKQLVMWYRTVYS